MRLKFYLDKPDRDTTSVLMNIAIRGKRFRFATGITLAPKHWNPDRQQVRPSDPGRNSHQRRLDAIAAFVKDAYNEILPSGKEQLLDGLAIDAFASKVRAFLVPDESNVLLEDLSFFDAFALFIETYTIRTPNGMVTTRRPGESTLKLYRQVERDLKQWSLKNKIKLTYDRIDEEFYNRYYVWLSEGRGIVDSTIANYIKVLKIFMKWTRQKGWHKCTAWENFWRDHRTGDTIALTLDEVRRIRDLDLTGNQRLNRTRDIFLLQVFTGMRYGDLANLLPRHFDMKKKVIHFTTAKTDTKCIIPITRPLADLLKRYPSKLFEFPSNVKMNLYLKELGKAASLDQMETVSHYRRGQRVEEHIQRAELLTTHVARRTFVSLSIRFGVSESVISAVTGHAAKGMLQKHYIVLDEETVCDLVCTAWEKL